MKKTADTLSVAFTQNFIIEGVRETVSLADIEGIEFGSLHSKILHPATALLVTPSAKGRYLPLNINDQRLSNLLRCYSASTQVEVIVVKSSDAEKVRAIAGMFIPQQSPEISFKDYFKSLLTNPKTLDWIKSSFNLKKSKSNSSFPISLDEFHATLGSNAPSKTTLSRLLKAPEDNPTIITPPQQRNTEQPTQNTLADESKPLNEMDVLRDRWNTYEGRIHSFDEIYENFKNNSKYAQAYLDKLRDADTASDQFRVFVENVEKAFGNKS